MFTIHGGKTSFTQWALNEMLLNPHMNVGDEIRFRNRTGETCICYAYNKDGETVVNVPNELLQYANPILVTVGNEGKCRTIFEVNRSIKPDDYVFLETETHEPASLESRVDALEQNPGGSGGSDFDAIIEVVGSSFMWDVYDVSSNEEPTVKLKLVKGSYADLRAKLEAGIFPNVLIRGYMVYSDEGDGYTWMHLAESIEWYKVYEDMGIRISHGFYHSSTDGGATRMALVIYSDNRVGIYGSTGVGKQIIDF